MNKHSSSNNSIKHSALSSNDCRLLATKVVIAVLNDHASLARALPEALDKIQEKDRSLLQELCYGTLRHFFSLNSQVSRHLSRPLKEKDQDIHALLLIGAYQLLHTRIPAYAAINSSVNAANLFRKTWAKGLINAVLRNIQREIDAIETTKEQKQYIEITEEGRFDHPQWLVDLIKQNYGADAVTVFDANNSKAPLTLRVNRQKQSRSEYSFLLDKEKIAHHLTMLSNDAIQLGTAVDVSKLPLFSDGAISIQDEAAQLSAPLLKLSENMRVLDACAAPGGKTCHILEIEPSLTVTALDIDAHRCELIHENLRRLDLSAEIIVADASHPEAWWKSECGGKLFDRILVDAPCSATGVIRHHPDIKLLRKASDIPALAKTQLQLLAALWPLLTVNGILLYATCSILNQENDDVVSQFLAQTPDARIDIINEAWGITTTYGKQLLPQKEGHDGFYFSRIKKIQSNVN